MMGNNFVEWLAKQLEERGWSIRETARRAEISHTTIADVLAGNRMPTWDFCAAIAKVFEEPPVSIFIKAGLLSVTPESERTVERLSDIIREMPIEKQQELLWYALALSRRKDDDQLSLDDLLDLSRE